MMTSTSQYTRFQICTHFRIILLASLSAAACTPIAGGPPPTQIPFGSKQEVGLSNTTALQLNTETSSEQFFLEQAIWYRRALGEQSELQFTTGVFWGGGFSYYGVAGFRRYFTLAEGQKAAIDIKLGGPFYAEVGLPLSKQIAERPLWLTAHPSLGLNAFGGVHIPVGISWRPKENVQCNTSIGSRFTGDNPSLFYWNLGVSFPF